MISSIVNSYAPSSPFERLKAQNLQRFIQMFVGLICLFLIKNPFWPFFISATDEASLPREKISSDLNNSTASAFDTLSPDRTLFFIFSGIDNYKSKTSLLVPLLIPPPRSLAKGRIWRSKGEA